MALTFDFTPKGGVTVDDGTYRVKLVKIGMPQSGLSFDGKSEIEKSRFYFEVMDGEYEGAQVSANVNIGASGPKSTLFAIASALLNGTPDGQVSEQDLLGKECRVSVVNESRDGVAFYSNIKGFMPPLPRGVVAKKPAPKPVATVAAVATATEDDADNF